MIADILRSGARCHPGLSCDVRLFFALDWAVDKPKPEGLLEAAAARRLPLNAVAIDSREAALLYKKRLVLVRQDGHAAWRGNAPPVDPYNLIDKVRGA